VICPKCGCPEGKLGAGKGPHAASWRCARCDRWLAWVSKREFGDMIESELTDAMIEAAAEAERRGMDE
jgi:hypothetical protein